MTSVENTGQLPSVKIGFGTRGHEAALLTAGAERVFLHPRDLAVMVEYAGLSLRPGDTLLMMQPGLLSLADYKAIYEACGGELLFQVVGHDPFALNRRKHFVEFRKVRPRGVQNVAAEESTGRPRSVASFSLEQADAIIRVWHHIPRYSHAEIVDKTKAILGLPDDADLKSSWVRDVVKKYVGTAQREKPDHWNGLDDA